VKEILTKNKIFPKIMKNNPVNISIGLLSTLKKQNFTWIVRMFYAFNIRTYNGYINILEIDFGQIHSSKVISVILMPFHPSIFAIIFLAAE